MMGNLAPARLAALLISLTPLAAPEAATDLPQTIGYTFFVGGKRVGHSDTRVVQGPSVLRFESKLRVESGPTVIELATRTEADPHSFEIRRFSYRGAKGNTPMASSVAIEGDSVFGAVSVGNVETKKGIRIKSPVVVWEDWVMEIEILLALRQTRAKNPSTVGLLLASSYAGGNVTLGYTGQASVDGSDRSLVAQKLLIAIQGGEPFESFVDPKQGIPVYIRFPGLRAEIFLDDFFGDNPVPSYKPKPDPASGR